jgi:hypothetical protein
VLFDRGDRLVRQAGRLFYGARSGWGPNLLARAFEDQRLISTLIVECQLAIGDPE